MQIPTAQLRENGIFFFGEKMQDEDKENPFHRVVPTPEGWKIEINDTRIREELEKKKLTAKKLQREFIKQFNNELVQGVGDSIWREKLTSVKDIRFRAKVQDILTISFFSSLNMLLVRGFPPIFFFGDVLSQPFVLNIILNRVHSHFDRGMNELFNGTQEIFPEQKLPTYIPRGRKIDAKWEFFMPPIEIDKVARSFIYLQGAGRMLVREKKEKPA